MSGAEWAFWLAFAALIAASGKFLDDYHIKAQTKAKIRGILIRWFVWLDAHKVPDLGGLVLTTLRSLFQTPRPLLVAVSLAVAYWATLSAFYLGRGILGPPNDQSYSSYLLTWIPLDSSAPYWMLFLCAMLVPGVLGLFAMAYAFHRASLANGDGRRLALLAAGLLVGTSLALSGAVLALLVFGGGGYAIVNVILAGAGSVALPALLAGLTLLLILMRYGIKFARFLLLQVFHVASSPTVSPFTYASSLLGVIILAAKVVQAALPAE